MKLKTDFVTNSSSSSFIVVFDKKITQFEDVEHLIPGPETKALQVYEDAKAQTATKISDKLIDRIAIELTYGYNDDLPGLGYSEYQKSFCERENINHKQLYENRSWQQAFYKEYENATMKASKKKAIDFIKQHEGKYLYMFNYGDEDGQFMSEMEHGATFSRVPHIHISKH